jgi:hypothetical protein
MRRWLRVDIAAIVLLAVVSLVGYLLIANERDNRVDALAAASGNTRIVACANADFASGFNKFLIGAAERTRQRIGTPDELSTDRAGLASTEQIIALFTGLVVDVEPICGPIP